MTHIHVIHENATWLEPLARASDAEAETLNALGIAYIRAGRLDAAARMFERVLSANPSSSVPLENLGMMALERLAVRRRAPWTGRRI